MLLAIIRDPKAEKSKGKGLDRRIAATSFIANIATGATGNGDEGFRLRDVEATENLLIGNIARGNGLFPCNLAAEDANPGISITGNSDKGFSSSNWILHNTVDGNCVGIFVNTGSMGNWVAKNTALDNGLIDLVDGNSNCEGNTWWNNEFNTSAVGPLVNEDLGCIQ